MNESNAGSGDAEVSFDELVEIERATALIQDRDPATAEAVVAARLRAKAERQKRDEQVVKLREAAAQKRRSRRRKIAAGVVGAVLLAASGYPLSKYIQEETRRSAALTELLDEASAPVRSEGFKTKEDWTNVGASGVAVSIPKGTCSAVVAVREGGGDPGPIRVERQRAKAIEGTGGHIWCSCDGEEVTVRPVEPGDHRFAVRWLAGGTAALGGVDVLGTKKVSGFSLRVDDFGSACADQAFEAWSDKAKNGRIAEMPTAPPEWVAPLLADGLEPVGLMSADRPFAVVEVDDGRCMLATAKDREGAITVRGQDGERLAEHSTGSLAWCAYEHETRYSLWRDGTPATDWAVLSIESTKAGGMAGLRALALRHDLPGLEGILLPEELPADALAALLASSVTKDGVAEGTGDGLAPKPEHRVVAFSMFQAGAFVADEASLAPMGCYPMPDPKASLNAFVCVQAKPQRWRPEGSERAQAAASGKLPFWLAVLNDVTDPKALQAAAELLGFARRMSALGAEPSSAFGVKDEAWGATVRGHANKKTVVAVGITKTAPWVHPLSADAPWTLAGPVPMVEVASDGEVALRSKVPLGFNASARRVVAWRR